MAKSVWVIESGYYSDYKVDGIYSTKENAILACELMNKTRLNYDKGGVSEWVLDPDITEMRKGYRVYQLEMVRSGDVTKVSSLGSGSTWENIVRHKKIPPYLYVSLWAKNEKHAIKVANERRIQLIASGEWD